MFKMSFFFLAHPVYNIHTQKKEKDTLQAHAPNSGPSSIQLIHISLIYATIS